MSKMKKFNLISLQKIFNANTHDAFTDLQAVGNALLLCFRRASDHHSKDGVIVLQRRTLSGELIEESIFSINNSDLRDPRIHIVNGKLRYLSAYAKRYAPNSLANLKHDDDAAKEELVHQVSENVFWEYLDEKGSLTENDKSVEKVDFRHWHFKGSYAEPYHWCWRSRWHKGVGYSLAYQRSQNNLYVYRGKKLSEFIRQEKPILSLAEHQLAYPNESDFLFLDDNHLVAVVRRDADTFTTQVGTSQLNSDGTVGEWQWQALPVYLASPCLYQLSESSVLVAARYEHTALTPTQATHRKTLQYFSSEYEALEYEDGDLKTGLFILEIQSLSLNFLMPLPSAGDNGYPGIAVVDNKLFISYYSSADKQRSRIYLCKIEI